MSKKFNIVFLVSLFILSVAFFSLNAMGNHIICKKSSRAEIEILEMTQAIEFYKLDYGFIPRKLIDLVESNDNEWRGPYLSKRLLKDPWLNSYNYSIINNLEFKITSYGADKQIGGKGFNQDISLKANLN